MLAINTEEAMAATATRLRPQAGPTVEVIVRKRQRKAEKALAKLRKLTPSAPIAEEFARTGRQYPPPSHACPMQRARFTLCRAEALTYWPRDYVDDSGRTYDLACFEDEQRRKALEMEPDRSPYTAALDSLAATGTMLAELPLAAESEHALRAEIDRRTRHGEN